MHKQVVDMDRFIFVVSLLDTQVHKLTKNKTKTTYNRILDCWVLMLTMSRLLRFEIQELRNIAVKIKQAASTSNPSVSQKLHSSRYRHGIIFGEEVSKKENDKDVKLYWGYLCQYKVRYRLNDSCYYSDYDFVVVNQIPFEIAF